MAQIFGRQAFVDVLHAEGVTHLFGNPGTTELPIMQALPQRPELKFILGLQESVVVGMADGFARASGRLTAANVHVAPGLGHAMGALYNAKFSGSPIILTAGQQEQGHGLLEPLLYEPLVPMAQPLVKWSVEVTRIEDLPRIMHRAAKVALTPPTGPVFISLPGDVLNDQADLDLGQPSRVDARVRPSDESLSRLADLLLQAKNPVMIAGQEIGAHDALDLAAELADVLGTPVYQEAVPYRTSFLSEHPLYMGMLTRSQAQVRKIMDPHDVVFCLGADLLRMSVYSPIDPLPPQAKVAHLSERSWELAKNHATEWAGCAHVQETLLALLPLLKQRQTAAQRAQAQSRTQQAQTHNWTQQRAQAMQAAQVQADARPMQASLLCQALAQHVPAHAIVLEEALTSSQSLPLMLRQSHPYAFYGLASGGLGFGIPGAVGMSLAQPQRPVVALVGDGSAMYGIQGLWTAAHLKLPITYVIAQNQGYRIIKERLVSMQGCDQFIGMDMNDPVIDYMQLARSMGLTATRVTDPTDLPAALKQAIDSGGPNLIEVRVANGFGN
jgi:benzoylformate decarboxylase